MGTHPGDIDARRSETEIMAREHDRSDDTPQSMMGAIRQSFPDRRVELVESLAG